MYILKQVESFLIIRMPEGVRVGMGLSVNKNKINVRMRLIMNDLTSEKKEILNALLIGTSFRIFTFHTHFELRFFRSIDNFAMYKEYELPRAILLSIRTDWWFGDKKEWNEKVYSYTKGLNLVEPDEPVLCFELAALVWSYDSEVVSVEIDSNTFTINFKCGKSMTILNHTDMDYAWDIIETYPSNIWSVVCEDEKLYICYPNNKLF